AGFVGVLTYCSSHPDSAVTKCMARACEVGLKATPFGKLNSAPLGAEESLPNGIPADPVPVDDGDEDAKDSKEVRAVVQLPLPGAHLPAPVLIREDEDVKDVIINVPEDPPAPVIIGGVPVEWAAGGALEAAAPRMMPYCDDEVCLVRHMPYADEMCKPAFMPYADEDCGKAKCCGLRVEQFLMEEDWVKSIEFIPTGDSTPAV